VRKRGESKRRTGGLSMTILNRVSSVPVEPLVPENGEESGGGGETGVEGD
jgi:hypothetical protein